MIYLDHAATTPVPRAVADAMYEVLTEQFGNPSSQYPMGLEMKRRVEVWRKTVADALGCGAKQLFFTSCGTEADNWAIRGTAHAMRNKGKHLIISSIEHPAMLTTAKQLEKDGFEVTYLKVDKDGVIDLDHLKESIRPDTVFIGVMAANNEVGTIQPIKEVAEIAREHKITVFTDAVQAAGVLKLDVKELGVDMMSFSAHKFYGPKGVGVLYIKSGVRLDSIVTGGHQERMKRGGTTNVPAIVGMAEAFRLANEHMEENARYVTALRERFINGIFARVPHVRLNGHRTRRLPANADFSFEYIEGEDFVPPRPRGHIGIERFGVLVRFSGALARPSGARRSRRAGARFHTLYVRAGQYRRRNRLRHRRSGKNGEKSQGDVAFVQNGRRRKRICITRKS